MFMVLSSRLLYPIMYIQYTGIKYAKNLNIQCFDSKCYRYKTSKVRSIRYKYRTQFGLLPLAASGSSINGTQSKYDCCD